ncbi:MAG: efflux RND transporter periplasmic adaptor subunit, partial [Bacteroidales bacterium]
MADTSTPVNDQATTPPHKTEKKKIIFLVFFLLIAIIAAIIWWVNYNKYISTDDANLDSYRIDVAPMITGQLSRLYVSEGDSVKKGDPLFDLEKEAMVARRQEAEAQYRQLLAQLQVAQASLAEAGNNQKIAEIAEAQSKINFDRAKIQYEGGAITLEAYQNIEESYKSAKLQQKIAANRIQSVHAQIEATKMSAEAALANVETANTDLSYYQVTAPASGIIGKRWSLPGDIINAGQTVLTLNQGKEIWVAVYLEETKFSHIFLGQQVKFTLDAYDKLTFFGKIFYIGDNSASEFALVPP